jgi:GNAT superfamily N-acetyltransferase
MIEAITIEFVERPEQSLVNVLETGLDEFNLSITGRRDAVPFSVVMKDETGKIVGGIFAVSFWTWLAIDLFWIAEPYRRSGYGSQLLLRAEDEGRNRGAKKSFLNTHSFQASGFYEKYGYELYGQLKDFPPGFDRLYYVKSLEPAEIT